LFADVDALGFEKLESLPWQQRMKKVHDEQRSRAEQQDSAQL